MRVRVLDPAAAVLGAVVDEKESRALGNGLGELRQEELASRIDPVKILDQNDRRLATTRANPSKDPEQAPLARLGIRLGSRTFGIGYAQKLEHERHDLLEVIVVQQQRSSDLPARFPRVVLVGDSEVAPE